MKLEHIVLATTVVISTPAAAEEYPVYQGSPSKETFGRQWVGEIPQTREQAVTEQALENKISYTVEAKNVGDTLEIHVEKIGTRELYQDFLVVQTQEQTMYRPRSKFGNCVGEGLIVTGAAASIIGLFGVVIASASNHTACYDTNNDGELDDCRGTNQDAVNAMGATLGIGFAAELGGVGLVLRGHKLIPTEKTRTQELSRNTETRLMQSNQYGHKPATNIELYNSSTEFSFEGEYSTTVTTDSAGNAIVQLIPTDPGFAFTQEGLASIAYAQQLRKAGYSPKRFMPLFMQNAVPVTYTVSIETKATDGENAKLDVPVSGFTVPQSAIETIIIGL